MELSLSLQNGSHMQVTCDGRASHTFELESISGSENPEILGESLYDTLFLPASPAHVALESAERLALVLDHDLEAIPWEFLCSPEGFLALEMPIVRLISPASRRLSLRTENL